ncbi:CinA family protein (plasmid) [Coraliomargarita sp. W4R53]
MPATAADVLAALKRRAWSIGTAESLTGGLVAATIVNVPGASACMRGGVVAYATDVKQRLLGVDAALLAAEGPVHPVVAAQMAEGVCRALGADVGLATTGVAGPDSQDGKPVGTVYLAVATPEGTDVISLLLDGDRAAIRQQSVEKVFALCLARL